jgi:high-affinity iron transporter
MNRRGARTRGSTVLLGLLAVLTASLAAAQSADPGPGPGDRAQAALHILDYVAVDYPGAVKDGAVVDQGEYDEQVEFAARARAALAELPARPEQAGLLADADRLVALVKDRRPGAEVAALASRMRWAVIKAYQVQVAPRRPPDLRQAAALYASQCATCHGAEGKGDGPAGRSLDPKPADFHDRGRMDQRSVHGLYSAITLGVDGTGMVGFKSLDESQRWALAFYVASLGRPEADARRGAELWQAGRARHVFRDLGSIATPSAREIEAQHGRDAALVLGHLQAHPDQAATPAGSAIATSIALLRQSVDAYRDRRARDARDLAASSYLDGFELAEASLDAVDRSLRADIEAEMLRYRGLVRAGAPLAEVEAQAARVEAMLDRARERLETGGLPAGATFLSAFAIVLREGLEALLIVAAMYALLVRAGRRDALVYVHGGWVAALVLGGITWFAASHVVEISGASREVTEGVTALLATGVLIYVGLWMHGKRHAHQWQAYLDRRLAGAVAGTTLWTLALVSFLAVYREAFETVLFCEAVAVQAGPAGRLPLLAGLGAAAAALLVLGWLIVKGSLRLPLGVFFGASSVLLAVLAVVFAGKGIAALQEAGWLPVHEVHVPSLPALGLYPNLQGLLLQAAVVILIAAGFAYTRRAARRP